MNSVLVSILLGLSLLSGQRTLDYETEYKKAANKGLLANLAKMYKLDQEIRGEITKLLKEGKEPSPELIRKLERADREHTGQMKQIVRTYGWPTQKMAGPMGAEMAWLLVQHADHLPTFQRECLELMKPLLPLGEVAKGNYAYLTDRVLIAEGKKQLYGTQFQRGADGTFEPKPLEDPENVDKRRAEMGLGTLEEYKKLMEQAYGKKPPEEMH